MKPITWQWMRRGTLAFLLGFVGCTDQPQPTAPDPAARPATSPARMTTTTGLIQEGGDLPIIDRFHLELRAHGAFRPGTPIQISVDATANLPTEAATLDVIVPEVELARASSWGTGFSYRSSGRIPPTLTRSWSGLGRGAALRETTSITIPTPGYYRVVARIWPTDTPAVFFNGRWIRNTAYAETWLLITDTGGQSTPTFDPDRIPDRYRKDPGPFRVQPRAHPGPPPGPSPEMPAHGPNPGIDDFGTSAVSGTITYHAKYYDFDLYRYEPVALARFQLYLCTFPGEEQDECEDWELITSERATSSGNFTFECEEDQYEVSVLTYASSTKFQVGNAVNSQWGDVESDCGGTYDITLPSAEAKVFMNMDKAVDGFMSLFGERRSFIDVWIDTDTTHTSHYSPSEDHIVIVSPNAVWEGYTQWGSFVAAHEYGHAFHEDALDENMGSACGQHFLDTESSLGCAFSEGFANFAGAATRPDLQSYAYRDYMEDDDAFPGCAERDSEYPYECTGGESEEGSLIEGAFAAFLFNLTDNSVAAHDSISAPGSYVADLFETCEVTYFLSPRRANGPDEISYCAENSINPDGYFTIRGATPYQYTESATEPASWTAGRVHTLWTWAMYEKQ